MGSGVRVDAVDLGVAVKSSVILERVSLSVLPGEFVGILGPSGSGKSTLLGALSGQIPPSHGKVLLDGREPSAAEESAGQIGFVPQDDIVHTCLKVERALRYSARLRLPRQADPEEIQARVDEVLGMVDLEDRRRHRIDKLSGGQRKRVSVGVELLTRPALLFLDEPTSGLDPALEERLMELFRHLTRGGRTVLLSTHVMQSLDLLDLIAVLAAGRLVFFGKPQEALQHFGVAHLADLYPLLGGGISSLAERYRTSPLYQQYVARRLAGV